MTLEEFFENESERVRLPISVIIGLLSCLFYVSFIPSISLIDELRLYNEKRFIQVITLAITSSLFFVSSRGRNKWLEIFSTLPLISRLGLSAVVGMGVFSSTFSAVPFYSFLELSHYFLLFVLSGVVAIAVNRAPVYLQKFLLGTVTFGTFLYILYFAVGYGMHLGLEEIQVWPNGGTNFVNIRFFNHYQTWTLPLLGGAILVVPRSWRAIRIGIFSLLALWWTLVFASNVRGTIVAIAVATTGVGLIFRHESRRWIIIQVAAIVIGSVFYYLLFRSGQGLPNVNGVEAPPVAEKFGTGDPRRLQHWRESLEMVWAHPLLGVGPMHFAWPPYQFTGPASPHNALMQWLAEWGIPSTLIMGGLTVWGGWSWIQQERRGTGANGDGPNPIRVALVASLLAGAAHSMVSGLIVAPLSQMCLVLLGGWAWGRYRHDARSASPVFSVTSHTLMCMLLAGAMGVVAQSLQNLSDFREQRSEFIRSVDQESFSPRYWLQGYIGVRDSSFIERARRER